MVFFGDVFLRRMIIVVRGGEIVIDERRRRWTEDICVCMCIHSIDSLSVGVDGLLENGD